MLESAGAAVDGLALGVDGFSPALSAGRALSVVPDGAGLDGYVWAIVTAGTLMRDNARARVTMRCSCFICFFLHARCARGYGPCSRCAVDSATAARGMLLPWPWTRRHRRARSPAPSC